jgi:hypothetical protein
VAEHLAQFLADRDAPCPGCGYNLRGLTSDRCPECNQFLVLRVGLAEPRMGWFLTAVIGAAAGLGLNGLLLIYIVVVMARGRGGGAGDYFVWHNGVGAVVHGLCMWVLLRAGPRIRRLDLPARIAIAAAMWAVALVNIVIFSVMIK